MAKLKKDQHEQYSCRRLSPPRYVARDAFSLFGNSFPVRFPVTGVPPPPDVNVAAGISRALRTVHDTAMVSADFTES